MEKLLLHQPLAEQASLAKLRAAFLNLAKYLLAV